MRHSDPALTANVYTDPRLLDVHGALDALPDLPLDAGPDLGRESFRVTGTADGPLAPPLAPTWCKPGQTGAIPDNRNDELAVTMESNATDAKRDVSRENRDFSRGIERGLIGETTGIEPATSWLQSGPV
jgi:hypothetical protein